MTILLYALLIAHLNTYKEYYSNIWITFAITYVMKRLIRTAGQKEHSEILGLGGYSLTIGEFVKLIGAIKHNGMGANSDEANKIMGGLLGKGIDSIMDLIKK